MVGKTVENPKKWLKSRPGWMPDTAPLDIDTLLSRLSGSRPEAFEANRRLEAMTGIRMWTPRAKSFGELRASLRLWQPPPNLEIRWRRILKGSLVRMTIALVGYHEEKGMNGVIWAREAVFPAVEDRSESGGGVIDAGNYVLHVQSRLEGTRLVYNEHLSGVRETTGRTAEYPAVLPVAFRTNPMKAMVVLSMVEVLGRFPPRAPAALSRDLRGRLRKGVEMARGLERERLLLALAYFQDDGDLEYLREKKASAALLLLGDPAGLAGKPHLEPHEIEMALRKATDPAVRAYLEGLKKQVPSKK